MKFKINSRWYESSDLTFIASFRNNEDRESYYFYSETLFGADDNTFILLLSGNAGSRIAKAVEGKKEPSFYFKVEESPGLWLLNNGHERLAGFLFPELRIVIEQTLFSSLLHGSLRQGETFYIRGEAKGETNGLI